MKKMWILLLILGVANVNLCLFAQQRNERRKVEFEALKEKRVAFITQAMDLNAEEAKVFWPLYNELQEKKLDLNQQMKKALYEFTGKDNEKKTRTESEYKEIVNLLLQFKMKEAKLEEEYTAKFAKVLSYEKIFRYQQAEQQFARQMLNQRRGRANESQK